LGDLKEKDQKSFKMYQKLALKFKLTKDVEVPLEAKKSQ